MSKKILLTCLALFLFAPSMSSAQVYLEYGAKGGVSFSNIRNLRLSGTINRTAPAGGVFGTAFLTSNFALQTELLYMGKGDQIQFPSGGGDERVTIKLNYVEVPILAKLEGPLLGNAEVGLYAGPSFSLKVDESIQNPVSEDPSGGEEDFAKGIDFGASVGVEFGFGLGTRKLLFDVRFTPGLSSIKQGPQLPPEASNQSLTVMAGFGF